MAEGQTLNERLDLWEATAAKARYAEMLLSMLDEELEPGEEGMAHHTGDLARAMAIGMSIEPFSPTEKRAVVEHDSNNRLSTLWLTADGVLAKNSEARGAKLIGRVCDLYREKILGPGFS